MIAYLLIHGAGPLYILINFLIYLIIFAIVWLIFKQIAGSFGISPQILNLIGLLLFLLLVLSLFIGCSLPASLR